MSEVVAEVRGEAGLLTLARPKALNALSLQMIRELTAALRAWRDDPEVKLVALRGMGREGPFGAFCAGGDIRFFHQAVLAGDPRLEDFFTEEYVLNHLIHVYPKPFVVFMDGIVMGGGMGISGHGAFGSLRIVTERTKMAMPETNIGLFPDVGGGWFLAHLCPPGVGEYLGLTGNLIGGNDARIAGLADGLLPVAELEGAWQRLGSAGGAAFLKELRQRFSATPPDFGTGELAGRGDDIARIFTLPSVREMVAALEAEGGSAWAVETAAVLRKRSPLMLHVSLRLIRTARGLSLADELRLERDLVRHAFHLRPGTASETMEGIRALVIDKDQAPRWNPARIEDVSAEMVDAFFAPPWPRDAHPLRHLT
ncbi:MAG TPA: enoyl-CoA hydratase/isomerase family protein [Ramlibacter sp.]|jgi:enoyl-CoA hydratase